MEFKIISKTEDITNQFNENSISDFLFHHLEQYGDKKEDILKCIAYAINPNQGGKIIIAIDENKAVGITILNNTGMKDYIPENILVYIAVDGTKRGKGYGKKLMQKAIESVEGNIALHVEPNNTALHLYEKLGFENKYLEMRLTKK